MICVDVPVYSLLEIMLQSIIFQRAVTLKHTLGKMEVSGLSQSVDKRISNKGHAKTRGSSPAD